MYPIPANATRIRYLESTGTQYIDSGVAPGADFGFAIAFSVAARPSATSALFGARTSSNVNANAYCAMMRSTGDIRLDTTSSAQYSAAFAAGDAIVYEYTKLATIVNGTSYTNGSRNAISRNFYLFALNNNGTAMYGSITQRYTAVKIYDGSTLVRDYVPVRVGSVGYLFDRVSGQLFGNAGTGSFVLGPDTFAQGVVPTRMMAMGVMDVPVEVGYITSNGNVVVPLDFVLASSNLSAKHTITASVSGAYSSGSQYESMLVSSQYINNPSSVTRAEKGGFRFNCSNPDRRIQIAYGDQGWWNYANNPNYSYDQFHTFMFQHASTGRQFGTLSCDGNSVTMVATTVYGNSTTSDRDPTYNDRPVVLFGRYDYSTSGYGFFNVNSWRFAGWKIELGGQVIHEYVPARKGANLGVWDKATNKFFMPVGAGSLSFG